MANREAGRPTASGLTDDVILETQRRAGNRAVLRLLGEGAGDLQAKTGRPLSSVRRRAPVVQREWVGTDNAVVYKNAVEDDIEFDIPKYTRITMSGSGDGGSGRIGIMVGKPPPKYDAKENLSKFERAFRGRSGWMNSSDVTDKFPREDEFEIPNVAGAIPPLYHGTTRGAAHSIMQGRFKVTKAPTVGRSFGDGVYATPYITKAAVHAFGTASETTPTVGASEFAVGRVSPGLVLRARRPRILRYDQRRENNFLQGLDKLPEDKRAYLAVNDQLGAGLADAALRLVPERAAVREAAREKGEDDRKKKGADESPRLTPGVTTKQEITAAARNAGYDVIVYTGDPGDVVYVFLQEGDWQIDRIVIEGQVEALNRVSSGLEDLDWFHEASNLDRIQAGVNEASK
jgi:hypothetical protein